MDEEGGTFLHEQLKWWSEDHGGQRRHGLGCESICFVWVHDGSRFCALTKGKGHPSHGISGLSVLIALRVVLLTPSLYEWFRGWGRFLAGRFNADRAEHLETRTLTGDKKWRVIYWTGGHGNTGKHLPADEEPLLPDTQQRQASVRQRFAFLDAMAEWESGSYGIIHIHLFMMATDLTASPVKTQQ